MEENINIAEIFENKSQGTKLYSLTYGDCFYQEYTGDFGIECQSQNGVQFNLDEYGRYCIEGECILFPSNEMRDWAKFSWKKGDILVNSSGFKLFFDRWANDDYTRFFGKVNILEDSFIYETEKYTLVSKDETLDNFGIEKPEFKDGDIAFADYGNRQYVFIVSGETGLSEGYNLSIYLDLSSPTSSREFSTSFFKKDLCELRLATEEEKKQIFSVLEKKGEVWNSEHKMIVDLKPKCEFKPMDLCLMKYIGQYNNRGWELCQYAYTEHRVSSSGEQRDFYHSVGGEIYAECIPYNEDTKHLLGTKTEWKGGEQ